MAENTGFFSQLAKRRIPQFLGIFLAGSWTALEFTQWAVGRYSLSPNWEEVLVVFLLLCLPLILVLAWHHGAPGKQNWSLFEKVFIPLYLVMIPMVLHHLYKDTDLNKTVETIMVADESGAIREREVVRSEYIIPLIIYPLKNNSQDPSLDELALMSTSVLERDIGQSKFISINPFRFTSSAIRRSQLSPLALPLTYQINFAQQRARDYLINGTIDKQNNNYQIDLSLYSAKTGELTASFSATSSDYFELIDNLTKQINKHFSPNGIRHTDLPIGDLYTSNWEAFNDFNKAQTIDYFGDKKPEAEQYYKAAIEKDPTFAIASFNYALYELNQNKLVSAKGLIDQAVRHGQYRLTEQERLAFNTVYFQLNKQVDRAIETLDQWIALYPNDWVAYFNKARLMQNLRNYDEFIHSLKKVVEIDPSQHRVWDAIGDTYSFLGKYDQALEAYNKFRAANPTDPVSEKNIGDLYSDQGKHDLAISQFQKALTLDPSYTLTVRNLARIYARTGEFKKAEETYKRAIAQSSNPDQKLSGQTSLAELYWNYGLRKAATDLYIEAYSEFSETKSSAQSLFLEAEQASRYFEAGNKEHAENVIKLGLQAAQESNEDVMLINVQVGQVLLLNAQGKPEEALPLMDNVAEVARSYLEDGNDIEINYIKGRVLFAMEKYTEAKSALKYASDNAPNNIGFSRWLAKTYYQLGEFDKAQTIYSKILNIAPGYPAYNFAIAKVLVAENQHTEAKQYLEKALNAWQYADMEFDELLEAKELLATI